MKRRAPHPRAAPQAPPPSTRSGSAASKAAAAERQRIRRMNALERALLALDLGERLRGFAKRT